MSSDGNEAGTVGSKLESAQPDSPKPTVGTTGPKPPDGPSARRFKVAECYIALLLGALILIAGHLFRIDPRYIVGLITLIVIYMMPRINERYIAPVFITLILLAGQLLYGILESPLQTVTAILASMGVELVLGRMFTGKWPHLASAYITGISVGILVRSPFLWPYALCSAIAVTSKYVIRVKGRHLWNPSNLGIVCLLLLAPKYVSTLSVQFDNSVWPMVVIWALGSIIIYRLKRFHICLTYVVCFIAYAFLRHLGTHDPFLSEVAPITGPMYQLFTFFMITDPKTTVKSKRGQIFVTILIATAEHIMRFYFRDNDLIASHAPYFALTLVGPSANLVEIWQNSRKQAGIAQAKGEAGRTTPSPVKP